MSVVVSGLGLVNAYGTNVAAYWWRLLAGDVMLSPARRFDATEFRSDTVAECLHLVPDRVALTRPWELPPGPGHLSLGS